jgi:high-affinity Fe2+/Pb2+ permease
MSKLLLSLFIGFLVLSIGFNIWQGIKLNNVQNLMKNSQKTGETDLQECVKSSEILAGLALDFENQAYHYNKTAAAIFDAYWAPLVEVQKQHMDKAGLEKSQAEQLKDSINEKINEINKNDCLKKYKDYSPLFGSYK